MKKLLVLLAIGLLTGCSSDNDDNDKLLSGLLGNETWTYKYAKVLFNQIDDDYSIEMYGEQQTESDPCQIFSSGEHHLRISRLPNEVGFYNVPADLNVSFDLEGQGANRLDATSGFVEILGTNDFRLNGVMQVSFDDENAVEGNFILEICR